LATSAYLVDVTRIASRLWRGALTGIDRVELAYIRHIRQSGLPAMALLRTPAGVLLLDPKALTQIDEWAQGASLQPDRDLIARLTRRRDHRLGRAETALRRHAIARAPMGMAGAVLRRNVPKDAVYLNTGHSNLTRRMMRALGCVPGLRIVVLVHDTIPMDHPEFTRPDQIAGFARKMAVVSDHADLIIHTAHATRTVTEAQMARLGRVPPGVVAPLGVDIPPPDPTTLPPGLDLTTPYFVTVGTIEPRKNHALLLDVWERLVNHGPVPRLYVVGNRGWADATLLARFDVGVAGVTVLPDLSDGAMMALVAGARALLFPSHVEGFGLPPIEAAALGTPVICLPLPVIKEQLGDYPVYLDTPDPYLWTETILGLATDLADSRHRKIIQPPEWHDHFKTVLNAL
jgi:glycosyltransferase involved in cell wall biosynthesis